MVPSEGTTVNGGAVRGNVALVNGFIGSEGAVFVFLRSQRQWIQTQTITGIEPIQDFNSLAIGPDYIAIGDVAVEDFRGGVHIYNEAGAGTYVFDSTLTAAGGQPGSLLGLIPIADDDTVLALAPGREVVSAFARFGGTWSEQAQFSNPSFTTYAFSGNRAFLPQLDGRPQEFVRREGLWTAGQKLAHPQEPDKFLASVAMAMQGRRAHSTSSLRWGGARLRATTIGASECLRQSRQ